MHALLVLAACSPPPPSTSYWPSWLLRARLSMQAKLQRMEEMAAAVEAERRMQQEEAAMDKEALEEAHERERVWFDMGVPGSPASKEAVARVRSTLSIKPTTQRLFEKVQSQSQMLAQECESFERKWARSKTKSAQPTRAAG